MFRLVAVLCLGLIVGCARQPCIIEVPGHPELRACGDGAVERVAPTSCPTPTPCTFAASSCSFDGDCATKDPPGHFGVCRAGECTCELCRADSDCPAHQLCDCKPLGATCTGTCASTSDCKANEQCMRVLEGPLFECQADDSPCRGTSDCWWPGDTCRPSDADASRWVCRSDIPAAPVP